MDVLRRVLWGVFGMYCMLMPVAYFLKIGPAMVRGNVMHSIDASLGLLMFLAVPGCLMVSLDKVLNKLE